MFSNNTMVILEFWNAQNIFSAVQFENTRIHHKVHKVLMLSHSESPL